MKAKPSEKERLEHMIEAIDRIFKFQKMLTSQTS